MASDPRNRPVIHMVVAMLILMVPVAAISAWFTRYPEEGVVAAVDYRPLAAQAAPEASFELLAPANLPEGWTCSRADWTPAGEPGPDGNPVPGDTWLLAFLTPAEQYIGLTQRGGDAAAEPFVRERTRDGAPDGSSTVEGATWTRYLSEDGRTRSLVATRDAVTVVSGDLPYEALEAFAGTLAPAASG